MTSLPTPTISVIIPTQRRPARLWRALASVAAQSYPAVEVVVVNDGGVPVEQIVARYRQECGRPIIYIALPEQRGVGGARNAGIAVASGTLLALLDDDDRYLPGHLARLAKSLADHPDASAAYDEALIQVEAGSAEEAEPRVVATCRFGLAYDEQRFRHDDYIVPGTLLLRREAFERAGRFDETLPALEDWDLLLRLRAFGGFHFTAGIGLEYSQRVQAGDNASSVFDDRRRATLDTLSARYGLPHLEPKTFLDVARELGFALRPTEAQPPRT
ncbi:MAG TPA: glycosyltransferase family 2 protein [Ktedonobacterales bacterium]|nr:glycosyltransferase family 2 protein [Ktedonobacterales bacterium]